MINFIKFDSLSRRRLVGFIIMFREMHRFEWPIIDSASDEAVIKQLHTSISLYKKEGIYDEFERAFADYHLLDYSVVFNSGTTAIWAMFGALGLRPGDEVLVPTYTFFATISPMIQWGLTPVFCDCSEDGNFDPEEIIRKKTERTKAVIVTHMWGIPCNMPKISSLCKRFNLFLLEDCSHAHGATIGDRKVGTWGDMAAWSLQGKKVVAAGQGGILATSNRSMYEHAVFLGHFNKRCFQELSPESKFALYSITGAGMNLRPSPLAIALANQQFSQFDQWLKQKRLYAQEWIETFSDVPFLTMPKFPVEYQPTWYALVMQYDATKSKFSRSEFVELLQNEYKLGEVDIPMSTCPNHLLPLFAQPHTVRPDFYDANIGNMNDNFPMARKFYDNAIKIFIPARVSDNDDFQLYIEGFREVAKMVVL
ncbi:MAG: aminotransferase class I/II-fold pyridoxal phosphate-dependent enzyme [Symploca sp. SIO3C6]|nr:aminotransferase class I/II-fold pyridoxal phosphate-dependent enzyme [Symploca sp. SIO3C6]